MELKSFKPNLLKTVKVATHRKKTNNKPTK